MRPLSFVIIGAGNIGKVHAEAIAHIPDARLVGICDNAEQRGHALAKIYGVDWIPDYKQAINRPDVDVVSVCTPSGAHAEIAVAAAYAGKHLMIEKPIEITLTRADQIIETSRKVGVKLSCIYPYRFMSGSQLAREAIIAGRLGRLTMADAYVKWYRPQEYYNESWHGTWALDGGGALMNQSIHSIDLLQWLAGPLESVFGRVSTLSHQMETEDTATAVLVFRNGALGVIQGATGCWPGDRARVELHGDRGTIVLEEGRITTWKLKDSEPYEEEHMLTQGGEDLGSGSRDPMEISYEMHRRQIIDLVQAIQEDRPPVIDGVEARKAVEIICAIYRSSFLEQTVMIPTTV